MGRLFFCPQSSTLTSAPSGMENGYLPLLRRLDHRAPLVWVDFPHDEE